MIKKGDIIEVCIDSLAYGGEGVGRYEGVAVFVPDTVPGDKVTAKVVSSKKNYAKAVLSELLQSSSNRIKPDCGISKVCGGCQLQHVSYEEQLVLKRKIVADNLKKIAGLEVDVKPVLAAPSTKGYRCKVQYPVQQTKVSKRFLVGYYKKGTHDIVNIKHCPVQPAIIDDIVEYLRTQAQSIGLTAYTEKQHVGLIRHFVFRYSHTDGKILLIIVINADEAPAILNKFILDIKAKFSEISGILVDFNTSKTNVIMANNLELFIGDNFIKETLEDKVFKVSGGSFFQVNPETAVKIFTTVRDMVLNKLEKPVVLDLYSGVGTFSIFLQDVASKIIAVEENPSAVNDAKENLLLNKSAEKSEIVIKQGNVDDVLLELQQESSSVDVTVLDPPRKGCSSQAVELIAQLTKQFIIYVSCDPATLARDIKIFSANGFDVEYIQPADMFPNTYHIESIALLKRK